MVTIGIYLILIINDQMMLKTDDFLMSEKQEIITAEKLSSFSNKIMSDIKYKFEKQKSLIVSHDPQEKYLISVRLLKLFSWIRFKNNKNCYC